MPLPVRLQLADVLSEEAWDLDRLVDTLEGLPVFAPLSSAELRQFARLLRLQVYPGGTVGMCIWAGADASSWESGVGAWATGHTGGGCRSSRAGRLVS